MFERVDGLDDKALLENFARKVESLISTTIRAGGWTFPDQPDSPVLRLHPEALEPARAALEEFEQQGHLEKLTDAIGSASEETLRRHGLTGAQLRFKLTIVRLRERLSRRSARPNWPFRRFRMSGFLRRLIEAIDNVLESLIDAVGVGGPLKEMKDAVMHATEK